MKNKISVVILLLIMVTVAMVLPISLKIRNKKNMASKRPDAVSTQSLSSPLKPHLASDITAVESNSFKGLMETPIEFYGVVLDQDNEPVPSATISGKVLDSWEGSPISVTSGSDGRFAIISKGTALNLKVAKPGYYHVREGGHLRPSTQGFDFGYEESPRSYRPDRDSPNIFQLRKAASSSALERLTANPKVLYDGTPVTVTLSKTSNIFLRIIYRDDQSNTDSNVPFDWRCEIIIDGGGIQEATNEHVFIAPDGGYIPSAVIDMQKKLDMKQWDSRVNKIYWISFSDNTFGKISFRMQASGRFAVVNGFLNLTPGDRNIEFNLDDL